MKILINVFALLALVAASAVAQQPTVPAAPRQTRVVAGIIRDSAGAPLGGSQVSLGARGPVPTSPDGRFVITGVPVGLAELAVHRVGYRPFSMDVDVEAAARDSIDVVLQPLPVRLAGVTATAKMRADPPDSRLDGFRQRSVRHIGYFITRDQIDRKTNKRLVDALRGIPGVRTVSSSMGRSVRLGASRCPPLVFVDGFPATAGSFDLESVDVSSLEGVEVYENMATIPADLLGPGDTNRCGVIALWSRPARIGDHKSPK